MIYKNIKETNEQFKIISNESSFLLVNAFAGTGKTTTLIKFAETRPSFKFLYLAFNKSIANASSEKFTKNVSVLTAHSIAYKHIGYKYKNKLKDLKYIDIKNYLKNNFDFSNSKISILSKNIINSINDYCYSAYNNIKDVIDFQYDYGLERQAYLDILNNIWEKMIDLESDFPVSHDFYLKLFQLSNINLNYDYILFDEAQDANPAIMDIVLKQNKKYGKKIILIGDIHQSIYSFRGSENTFKKIKNIEKLYLTQSFRFGNEIASAVNSIISVLKNESNELKGNLNIIDSTTNFNVNERFTILCRTNANLFLKACELAEKNKKVFYIGGLSSYNFFKIKDIENLYNGRNDLIKDTYISSFKSFEGFYKEIKEIKDTELINLSRIVDKYKGKTQDIYKKIKSLEVLEIKNSDVVLSSVHKSKGLEFDQVWLSNDFLDFINEDNFLNINMIREEEVNILYVAASRAKKNLRLNTSLRKIIEYYKQNYNKNNSNVYKNKKEIIKFKSKLKKINNKINKD